MSALSFELYCVIFPVFATLLLYVLQVPFLSKQLAKAVGEAEKLNVRGVTPLTLLSIILSFAFLNDFLTYQNKFSEKQAFPDLSLSLQNDVKRLRLERNIYIHMAGCASCLAVKVITKLHSTKTKTD
ncbi:hypothetical protein ADEAN_000095100 [Angomonas deanei]|uniref:Endoplasmic reticulum transmembrane protein n=1 Tax=Angomonas deanei TaxID=59799 RepID=A0A7G2C169_9TRYP|nr:hypothetical protein ADEAN_000095100 [Angomonas deanei]